MPSCHLTKGDLCIQLNISNSPSPHTHFTQQCKRISSFIHTLQKKEAWSSWRESVLSSYFLFFLFFTLLEAGTVFHYLRRYTKKINGAEKVLLRREVWSRILLSYGVKKVYGGLWPWCFESTRISFRCTHGHKSNVLCMQDNAITMLAQNSIHWSTLTISWC